MSKNLDHEELGIDLDRVNALPECMACRKKSDGAKTIHGFTLCGTHFDEVLAELARAGLKTNHTRAEYVRGYIHRMKTTTYRPCWDAKLD